MCTIRYTHISYVAINQTVHPLALGAIHSVLRWFVYILSVSYIDASQQLLSLLHGRNILVVTFLYSVALWAIQMVGWQLLFLPQPKAQARHEKPHIFFHSIDWLFDIHMNVFIYSVASEMALYLPELYSFCTIAVRGYNLNIAAKTSSSGLQIHTMVKAPPQS